MLTDAAKDKYIKKGGNTCPYCGSTYLDAGVASWGDTVTQDVVCGECDREWVDILGVVGIKEDSDAVV
jgi:transposase-like protein